MLRRAARRLSSSVKAQRNEAIQKRRDARLKTINAPYVAPSVDARERVGSRGVYLRHGTFEADGACADAAAPAGRPGPTDGRQVLQARLFIVCSSITSWVCLRRRVNGPHDAHVRPARPKKARTGRGHGQGEELPEYNGGEEIYHRRL